MKISQLFVVFGLVCVVFASCYKESNFLADNITIGKNTPSVWLNALDSTSYYRGSTCRLNVEWWCVDALDKLNIYDSIVGVSTTRNLISSTPYKSAFSSYKLTDTALVSYVVPATYTIGKKVVLITEAVSVNGVTKTNLQVPASSKSFTVK
jgi:hypothetical protein